MIEALTQDDKKLLRKQQRPAKLLATGLILMITLVNLAMYFRDILVDIDGLERPPLSQLIIVEVAAVLIGFSAYYFPSKNFLKDLFSGTKKVETVEVIRKYLKRGSSKPEYTFILKNKLSVQVDKTLYTEVSEGDSVIVNYVPHSSFIFSTAKKAA